MTVSQSLHQVRCEPALIASATDLTAYPPDFASEEWLLIQRGFSFRVHFVGGRPRAPRRYRPVPTNA